MKTLVLQYPEDLAEAVNLTPAELEMQVRLMAALKMFELGKLSSSKAAELAGMSRVDFLDACGRYHVAISGCSNGADVADELASDAKAAKDARQ